MWANASLKKIARNSMRHGNALLISCYEATADKPQDMSDTHLRAFLSRRAFSSWVTLTQENMNGTDLARQRMYHHCITSWCKCLNVTNKGKRNRANTIKPDCRTKDAPWSEMHPNVSDRNLKWLLADEKKLQCIKTFHSKCHRALDQLQKCLLCPLQDQQRRFAHSISWLLN